MDSAGNKTASDLTAGPHRHSSSVSIGYASCRTMTFTGCVRAHNYSHSISLTSSLATRLPKKPRQHRAPALLPRHLRHKTRHSHFTRAPATGAIEARRGAGLARSCPSRGDSQLLSCQPSESSQLQDTDASCLDALSGPCRDVLCLLCVSVFLVFV